ncbi:30S ribosomal protein S17 [Buchnera aphidicola]|uniref:30S ribosomal protein S17 n=1 Tax=Buchnera aphidicola TaxID=9 RepID=UPI0031B6C976
MSSKKNVLEGVVISNKMQKTVVVIVNRRIKHSVYKKIVQKRTKFYVHDEENICMIGDLVKIFECRPLSKLKSWKLLQIVKKSSNNIV